MSWLVPLLLVRFLIGEGDEGPCIYSVRGTHLLFSFWDFFSLGRCRNIESLKLLPNSNLHNEEVLDSCRRLQQQVHDRWWLSTNTTLLRRVASDSADVTEIAFPDDALSDDLGLHLAAALSLTYPMNLPQQGTLAKSGRSSPASSQVDSLQRANAYISAIDVSHSELGDSAVRQLLRVTQAMPHLRALRILPASKLADPELIGQVRAYEQQVADRKWCESNVKLLASLADPMPHQSVGVVNGTLDLSGQGLGDDAVHAVVHALQTNHNVRSLNVSRNCGERAPTAIHLLLRCTLLACQSGYLCVHSHCVERKSRAMTLRLT